MLAVWIQELLTVCQQNVCSLNSLKYGLWWLWCPVSGYGHPSVSFLIHEENEDVLLQTIDLDLGFLFSENEDQKLVSTVTEADIDNSAQIENVSSCLT